MLLTADDTKEGKFYLVERIANGKLEVFKFLRLKDKSVVCLEGVPELWKFGSKSDAKNMGGMWFEIPFSNLSEKEKQFVITNYPSYCVGNVCTCDSKDLFYSGCQCGHLKAIREAKRART